MTLKKIIKPLLISCALPLAFSANAEMNFMDKNNFIALSAGIDQPSVGNNNVNITSAKTTYVGSIEVGRKFYDRVSFSLEYKYFSKTDFNIDYNYSGSFNTDASIFKRSWSVRSDVFMANLAFNLVELDKITPYLKVGAGVSRNKANDYKLSEIGLLTGKDDPSTWSGKTSNRFAWQIGAGVDFETSEMVSTNIAYNFINRGKFEANLGEDEITETYTLKPYTNLQDHVFTIGIKFKF